MTEVTEAIAENIHVEGTQPQSIQFVVEAPPDLPDHFTKPTNQSEIDRLERLTPPGHNDRVFDIGRVPVRYENGSWEIAWAELEE